MPIRQWILRVLAHTRTAHRNLQECIDMVIRNKTNKKIDVTKKRIGQGGTTLYRASTNHIRSPSLGVAGGLGGGGLGVGGNDPFLIKGLEERLDDGTVSDLSTLKQIGQS